MRTIRISHLVQGPWSLMTILCLCLLFLYVLVRGGQQHIQPGSGELDKLRVEAAKLRVEVTGLREKTAKLRDEAAKLRDEAAKQRVEAAKLRVEAGKQRVEAAKLRDEAGKLRVEVTGLRVEAAKLRDEAAKLQEQMSAQNEMIKKLQDQNRALEFKIDKMQGDLHGCRNASVKHGELVQGLKRSLEINEGQNSNLRKETSAQNEMIKKLQDQNRAVQSKIDKMQGDLHGCRNASVKHGELVQGLKRSLEINEGQNSNLRKEMSAQNEMIKKLEDQNRDLEFKIDEMQDDLHGCRTESGRHGEQVQGLRRDLGDCGRQNSDIRYSLQSCRKQECDWQDDNKWWLNLPLGLGCFLRCCLGYCFK
ncbi:myosin heavy chain, cardiac muscle isoform-like [Amblyraja radiata]|uniref:myosin heavy chain, cardiac muscle isoform-like n=1 Tax=Amblyraja radiata TaxID=386614 RepID=UPI001401DAAE|nr:myosin heavy chain, cardiac muscle isoform-like [Amblyraja radiata]